MFSEKLQNLRKDIGLTQKELARHLNVATSTIGMWESSKREPDIETLKALAKFFNISMDQLLEYDNPKTIINTQNLTEQIIYAWQNSSTELQETIMKELSLLYWTNK